MSGVLNLLLAGAASAIKDAYFNLTTLLLNTSSTNGAQNNTFLDSSSNNFTITRNGNTTQGTFTPFSQTGWSNYFNGSTDYLGIAANAVFSMSTGDFTYEAWVYPTSFSGSPIIFDSFPNSSGSFTAGDYQFYLSTGGVPSFQIATSTTATSTATGTAISLNAWTHIAVVRSGTTITIYQNGVSAGTLSFSTAVGTSTKSMSIGSRTTIVGSYFSGYISNGRITKGGALYTSTFTPSTTPLTTTVSSGTVSLLTCQSNRFLDNSSNAFAITANGTPSVQAFSPFLPTAAYDTSVVGGSVYFDGTGDFVTVPSNTAFDFAGNATIELWAYWAGNMGVRQDLIHHATNGFEILKLAGDTIYCGFGGGTITSSITVKSGQWYHIALVRSSTGASGLNLYINGVNVGSATAASSVTSGTMAIGAQASGASPTIGYFSSLRIVKGTAVYTAAFTPPTAPLTAISGTSLLLSGTNAGIYDSAAKNDLETLDNAQVSTTQAKFGTTSISLDGTNDKLVFPITKNVEFNTGDFTIECWVYLNSVASTGTIASSWQSPSNYGWILQLTSTAMTFAWGSGGGSNSAYSPSATFATGTWYHIAVTRSGTNLRLFQNGTQLGTTQTTSANITATVPFWIGANYDGNQQYINGYIDDFRITKGYARYTANFTPPTAAFPLQ